MRNKVIAIVLSCVMLAYFMVPVVAFAEMGIMASSLIKSTSTTTGKNGTTVTVSCKITANIPVEKLGVSLVKLQEQQGSKWVTVASDTSSYSYNNMVHIKSISHKGTTGKKYRCVVDFYIKNGSSTDSRSDTSSTVTL